jgi:alkylation response protein AidB-like acyl-CoA dehydrogenase
VLAAHVSCAAWIEACGSAEQRQSALAELASGGKIGALVGDAAITATASGAGFTLGGTQALVANATTAGVFVVVARLDGKPAAFLLASDTPGLRVAPVARPLGWRGAGCGSVRLDGVTAPAGSRLAGGGERRAAAAARLSVAAVAVGLAQGALDRGAAYAKERVAFGKTLSQQQAVSLKLGEMALKTDAARHLVRHAARLLDAGEDLERESLVAKVAASECATYCGDEAIQIHGGYGYVREYHVERIYRDAKTCEVAAGTNESCRLLVSARVLS